MGELLTLGPNKVLIAMVAGSVWMLFYYSIDIYLFITRKNFSHANAYLMHFTRHDKSDSGRSTRGGDALIAETILYETRLRDLYKNRWHFWHVIFASLRVRDGKHVLRFGARTKSILAPIRGRIAERFTGAVVKRAAGLAFVETHYQLCVVNDRSGRRRRRILQIFLFREEDLANLDMYLVNEPNAGKYVELFKEVAQAYQDDRANGFMRVRVTAA